MIVVSFGANLVGMISNIVMPLHTLVIKKKIQEV